MGFSGTAICATWRLAALHRLVKIVEDLASQPGESVPQASPESAATTAAYDFWNSPYFHPKDIRIAHRANTIERIKQHNCVLAIQDTTDARFHRSPSYHWSWSNWPSGTLGLESTFHFHCQYGGTTALNWLTNKSGQEKKKLLVLPSSVGNGKLKTKKVNAGWMLTYLTQQVIPLDIQADMILSLGKM